MAARDAGRGKEPAQVSLESDEEIARRLQEEYDAGSGDGRRRKQTAQLAADEALARALAQDSAAEPLPTGAIRPSASSGFRQSSFDDWSLRARERGVADSGFPRPDSDGLGWTVPWQEKGDGPAHGSLTTRNKGSGQSLLELLKQEEEDQAYARDLQEREDELVAQALQAHYDEEDARQATNQRGGKRKRRRLDRAGRAEDIYETTGNTAESKRERQIAKELTSSGASRQSILSVTFNPNARSTTRKPYDLRIVRGKAVDVVQEDEKFGSTARVLYSDGSYAKGKGGAGVAYQTAGGKGPFCGVALHVSNCSSSGEAEMIAIMEALEQCLNHMVEQDESIREVIVRTDSLASLGAIAKEDFDATPSTQRVRELVLAMVAKNVEVKLEKVKGHAGCPGNHVSDLLATAGRLMVLTGPRAPLRLAAPCEQLPAASIRQAAEAASIWLANDAKVRARVEERVRKAIQQRQPRAEAQRRYAPATRTSPPLFGNAPAYALPAVAGVGGVGGLERGTSDDPIDLTGESSVGVGRKRKRDESRTPSGRKKKPSAAST